MCAGGQRDSLLAVPPGNRSGSNCTGGWVGPRACLDCCGRSRPHRIVQPIASRLFQRRYPSPQVDNQDVFKRMEFYHFCLRSKRHNYGVGTMFTKTHCVSLVFLITPSFCHGENITARTSSDTCCTEGHGEGYILYLQAEGRQA